MTSPPIEEITSDAGCNAIIRRQRPKRSMAPGLGPDDPLVASGSETAMLLPGAAF